MGRRRPSWYYTRQAQEAQARETFLQNYAGPPANTIVEQRGASTDLFYRSLSLVSGTEHTEFIVQVPNTTLAQVTAAEAGLLTTTTGAPLKIRGSGVKPSRAHWYQGDPTPRYETSRWNTSYIRYYSRGTHKSVPFSIATGLFDADALRDAFSGLFGPSGTKRALLGATNGRAYLELEVANLSFNS